MPLPRAGTEPTMWRLSMSAREQLMAFAQATNIQPILMKAFTELLDALQDEWYQKGHSAGYHMRGQVDWELR
jgi:hypothetical protein